MFHDRLLETLNEEKGFTKLRDALMQSEVFLIDNVAEYLYIHNKQEEWSLTRDFPNCAPPFPFMFFEYSIANLGDYFHQCLYQHQADIPEKYRENFLKMNAPSQTGVLLRSLERQDISGIRWECSSVSFIEEQLGRIKCPQYESWWFCRDDGTIYLPNGQLRMQAEKNLDPYFVHLLQRGGGANALFAPLLALCFLHCKNIEVITCEVSPKLQRVRVKKGKNPLLRYHILDIKPVRRILEMEGGSNKTGLKRALHICRGHFKNYMERGLFGKLHGLYWWDAQVRGDITEGLTLKDYRVHTN